jgi:hypothetical protein
MRRIKTFLLAAALWLPAITAWAHFALPPGFWPIPPSGSWTVVEWNGAGTGNVNGTHQTSLVATITSGSLGNGDCVVAWTYGDTDGNGTPSGIATNDGSPQNFTQIFAATIANPMSMWRLTSASAGATTVTATWASAHGYVLMVESANYSSAACTGLDGTPPAVTNANGSSWTSSSFALSSSLTDVVLCGGIDNTANDAITNGAGWTGGTGVNTGFTSTGVYNSTFKFAQISEYNLAVAGTGTTSCTMSTAGSVNYIMGILAFKHA